MSLIKTLAKYAEYFDTAKYFDMKKLHFGDNLKYLKLKKGLNPAEFIDSIGIKRTTWSGYESNDSFPKVEELIRISEYFDVTVSDLLHSDLRKVHPNTKKGKRENVHPNVHPSVHPKSKYPTNDSEEPILNEETGVLSLGKGNVYDFDTKAAAGMATLMQYGDRLNRLPTFFLPDLGIGTHIRIKINGDSMHGTIKDGDSVIATEVTDVPANVRGGAIYVVLDKDEGVVCKRLYKHGKDTFELVSDNRTYKPYERRVTDIQAIFKVRLIMTTDMRNYNEDVTTEIRSLWKEIDAIKQRLP